MFDGGMIWVLLCFCVENVFWFDCWYCFAVEFAWKMDCGCLEDLPMENLRCHGRLHRLHFPLLEIRTLRNDSSLNSSF